MTRRQRSRKHAQRVYHQCAQRARLRAAIEAAAGDVLRLPNWKEVVKRMHDHGYEEGDQPGTWRRTASVPPQKRRRRR